MTNGGETDPPPRPDYMFPSGSTNVQQKHNWPQSPLQQDMLAILALTKSSSHWDPKPHKNASVAVPPVSGI